MAVCPVAPRQNRFAFRGLSLELPCRLPHSAVALILATPPPRRVRSYLEQRVEVRGIGQDLDVHGSIHEVIKEEVSHHRLRQRSHRRVAHTRRIKGIVRGQESLQNKGILPTENRKQNNKQQKQTKTGTETHFCTRRVRPLRVVCWRKLRRTSIVASWIWAGGTMIASYDTYVRFPSSPQHSESRIRLTQ